jgi:hypothetical protein
LAAAKPASAELTLPADLPLFLSVKLGLLMMVKTEDYSADAFAEWAARFWGQFDRNGDGVTADEVEYEMLEVPAQKDKANWEKYHKKSDQYLLSEYLQAFELDPDQDGTVTTDEMATMAEELFKFADADHSGGISAAEVDRLDKANARARSENCTELSCSWK